MVVISNYSQYIKTSLKIRLVMHEKSFKTITVVANGSVLTQWYKMSYPYFIQRVWINTVTASHRVMLKCGLNKMSI